MIAQMKRAVIYARCSTEESRQDVEVQLKELRRYCDAFGWLYDEVSEYGSGFKKDQQPKLDEVLEKIRLKHYSVLVCHSVDRFSRQSPGKINHLLDTIVDSHKCRFIALQQGIDSDNELIWHVVKPLFTYFANKYSRDLSDKIRKGIERKKERKLYNGGRPNKPLDVDRIMRLRAQGLGLRSIASKINEESPKKHKISYSTISRVLQKHGEKSLCEKGENRGIS